MRYSFYVIFIFTFFIFFEIMTNPQAIVLANIANQETIYIPGGDATALQQAINQVSNGGIIEVGAGIYNAPSPEGFEIKNIGKSFTIRAATGEVVILDGGGTHPIVSYLNTDISKGGPIIFEGLHFTNGRSEMDGRAGGVTLHNAQATFTNCSFKNNAGYQPSTGGGGIVVAINSTASFSNCIWDGNVAKNEGGGLAVNNASSAYISNSSFTNNLTNVSGHRETAAGGGIHVGNATLTVSNSRFEGNQAGYVGGAIYAIGNWIDPVSTPRSRVLVSNSVFSNNHAIRHFSVSSSLHTEGGAFHAEDQTMATIQNSTFIGNSADLGGGVNLYRATVVIDNSIFKENRAMGGGSANGFGAAISAASNDGNDSTTNYGASNRPSAALTVKDTVIEGISGQAVGQAAGGLYAAGDSYRTYGLGGVSKMGTVAENRAKVLVDNVIFNNTDVQEEINPGNGQPFAGTGQGGGMVVDLADLTMQDTLFVHTDALGNNQGLGGGILIVNQSLANVSNVTIANSTAGRYGAGIFAQGSEVYVAGCKLIENEISPGISESEGVSYGAAIFTGPDDGRNLPVIGAFGNCTISNNIGLPIFDDDRTNGPINDVRYNANQIYSVTFGNTTYTDSIGGYCCKTTTELNSLTVPRANGINTPKSQSANSSPATQPAVGTLLAVPSYFIQIASTSLQASTTYTYYLGYAWSGNTATLDGTPLTEKAGVVEITDQGQVHTLIVDGQSFTEAIEIKLLDKQIYLPVILSN